MDVYAIIRRSLLAALVLGASATALAQHGGGPGGGGGGPMGGSGMGMNRGINGNAGRTSPMGGGHFVAVAPTHLGLRLGLPGRWWDEKKTVKTLNLRSDQKSRMDEIFNANKGTLADSLTNFQREEVRLSSMTSAELQDEPKVFAQIDRLETARADLEKAKAHYLMQIRQQLDPDQLTRLDTQIASLNDSSDQR